MRRMVTAVGLITVTLAFGAACTSSTGPAVSDQEAGHAGGGRGVAAVPAAGSVSEVCGTIRSAITADLTSLGTALGQVVGAATGNDAKRRLSAAQAANTALRKIGADITAGGTRATDATVRSAASTAAQQVNALAMDPTVLTGLDSMADVPAVTTRLTQATASIASVCQGS